MNDDPRPSSWLVHREGDDDMAQLEAAVASRDWAVFEGIGAGAPPVALTVSRASDGRMICTGLLVGLNEAYPIGRGKAGEPTEVTSRALRSIPVAELIGRALYQQDHHAAERRVVEAGVPDVRAVRRSPGPKGHPIEHFRMVADLYRQALREDPRAPVAWLTRQLNADRSTVTRWVQRARTEGLLGESIPGRAGEAPALDDGDQA